MIAIFNHNPTVKCYVNGMRELQENVDVRYNDFRFTVPTGYMCNSSSIPRFFWRICGAPTTGPNLLAGIIHDYLYSYKVFDRKTCDKIFYECLIKLGKPKWIARGMYLAVRVFGGSHY